VYVGHYAVKKIVKAVGGVGAGKKVSFHIQFSYYPYYAHLTVKLHTLLYMEYSFVIERIDDKRYKYLTQFIEEMGYEVVSDVNFHTENKVVYIFSPFRKLTETEADMLKASSVVIANAQSDSVIKRLADNDIEYYNIFGNEIFAMRNAMITADGAVMLAANNTEISFSDMNILIFGYGRVGKACAKYFRALGSHINIFTINEKEYAESILITDTRYKRAEEVNLTNVNVIINTIPAPIFTKQMLAKAGKDVFILELASLPGGVDTEAVKKFNLHFMHAHGLPAKVAPCSAAGIMLEAVYSGQ